MKLERHEKIALTEETPADRHDTISHTPMPNPRPPIQRAFQLALLPPRQTLLPLSPHYQQRLFHSHEQPSNPPIPPSPASSARTAILTAALPHVPTHGFTTHALRAGARSAGYPDVTTNLIPHPAFTLLTHHLTTSRLALASHPLPPLTATTLPTRLRSLALHRLRLNIPFLPHYPAALALATSPRYLPASLRELALLADELLFRAGSTDVSAAWYVDRAGVAAVYASAEVFMMQDRSVGFVETEEFLGRRLEEGGKVKGGLGMMGGWVGAQVGGVVDGLRSKGVRI